MRKLMHALQCVHRTLSIVLLGAVFVLSFNTKTNAQCIEQINISLDMDCISVITPAMIGNGIDSALCYPTAFVVLSDPWGNVLPSDTVTYDMVGYNIKVELNAPDCGIVCWGYALIEDKFSPQVMCENDTVACHALSTVGDPVVMENCTTYDLVLLNEVVTAMPCDSLYTSMVTRTWTAEDESGNSGDTCTQKILIERVDLNGIVFPTDTVFLDNDNSDCFANQAMDANGNPSPSITGVPTQNGLSLYPAQILCMTYVDYTDIVILDTPCKKKIIRTWEVREWWCDGESSMIVPQQIDIIDTQAPFLVCPPDVNPPDFVAVTGQDCTADYVVVPPIILLDCNMPTWTVAYLLADADGQPPVNGAYTNVGVVPFGDTYIIQNLPAGRTWLKYTAVDKCHNISECFNEINIIDGSDPIAICQESEIVSLNTDGKAWLCAESIDKGSFDACGDVTIQVARMADNCGLPDNLVFGDCVEFCCADLPVPDGSDGCHMVVMQVTDEGGRTNQCMVEVCVQNKIPALLSCPPDVTVECTVDFDINNLDTQFGTPTVVGNCSQMVSESASSTFDNCGAGSITRIFTAIGATDGPPTVCTQVITFINSDPFDGTGISWPGDYTADDLCSLSDLDPEDLPAGLQGPVIVGDNECSLVGVDYDDEIFQFANGQDACFKIIRHWTIIDWCQKINGVHPRWEWEQILKINNTNGPVIGALSDVDVESTDVDCSEAFVPLTASATDDCTASAFIIWNYKIDANCDGSFDFFGTGNNASGDFPLGEHCIEWTAQDGCGNFTTVTQDFSVTNTKTPVPVCFNGLAAELTATDTDGDGVPDNEIVLLWAVDFDASSYSPCGYDIEFSFSANTNDTSIEFDCDDIGIQTIQMWVTDSNGGQSYCTTFVDIQDTNDDDICPPGLVGTVIGEIRTAEEEMIENVEVYLDGSSAPMEMTDQDGHYDFGTMPVGGSYMVIPDKDDDYLNGVTTLDLIFIQKHVLGLQTLDSPYKILAADVNNSESVTSIDIVELRKLILGIYADLPNNSSWNFLNAAQYFIDETNPWATPIDNSFEIENLQGTADIPFIGYKVGDVNNSAVANLQTNLSAENRTQGTTLFVDRIAHQKDGKFMHPVYASEYLTLEGMQATISMEGGKGQIAALESGSMEIESNNFAVHKDQSSVSMSWDKVDGIEIDKDGILFYIIVQGSGANDFTIAEQGLKSEVYTDGQARAFNLESRSNGSQNSKLVVNQNQPNPWSDFTEIHYELGNSSAITFTVFDIQGRKVFTMKDRVEAGKQIIRLSKTDLQGTGLYSFVLQTDNATVRKKMILVE